MVKQPYACIYSVFTTSPPHIVKTVTIVYHHTSRGAVPKSTENTFVTIIPNRGGEVVKIRRNAGVSPPRPQVAQGGEEHEVVFSGKNTALDIKKSVFSRFLDPRFLPFTHQRASVNL